MHCLQLTGSSNHADQHVHVPGWSDQLHDWEVQECLDLDNYLFEPMCCPSDLVDADQMGETYGVYLESRPDRLICYSAI